MSGMWALQSHAEDKALKMEWNQNPACSQRREAGFTSTLESDTNQQWRCTRLDSFGEQSETIRRSVFYGWVLVCQLRVFVKGEEVCPTGMR